MSSWPRRGLRRASDGTRCGASSTTSRSSSGCTRSYSPRWGSCSCSAWLARRSGSGDCRAAWGAIIFKSYSLCDNAIVAIGPIAPSQAAAGARSLVRRLWRWRQVRVTTGGISVRTSRGVPRRRRGGDDGEGPSSTLRCTASKDETRATAALMAVEGEDKLMEMIKARRWSPTRRWSPSAPCARGRATRARLRRS